MNFFQELLAGRTGSAIAYVLVGACAVTYYMFVVPALQELKDTKAAIALLQEEKDKLIESFNMVLTEKLTKIEESLSSSTFEAALKAITDTAAQVEIAINELHSHVTDTSTVVRDENLKIKEVLTAMSTELHADHVQLSTQLDALLRSLDYVIATTNDFRDKHRTLAGAVLGVNGLGRHKAQRIK